MRAFFKRHVLLVGFFAVLVPLLVLMGLQYSWLVDLEKKSAIAHEVTMGNYLETVTKAVEYFYGTSAEQILNVPAYLFVESEMEKIADFFDTRRQKGIRRLFVMSFVRADRGKLLFFDPLFSSMEPPTDLDEARAAYVACAPWQVMSRKGNPLGSVSLSAEERDPNHRMVLKPIVDAYFRVVGVAGMIVDEDYFRDAILPEAIERSMPRYFSSADQKNLVVHVHDGEGKLILGEWDEEEEEEDIHQRQRAMSLLFTDHRLGVRSGANPQEWAEASFVLNISLSVLLAAVLLGGTVLALRTASREMKLSQMKGDFVSNVSHELRTPLASIRVFSEFLKLGRFRDSGKIREYGEYIESESRLLTSLVNNLLDFSKIESGQKTYRFERTDVQKVVEDALKTFEVRVRRSGVQVTLDSPESLPLGRIDPDAIAQAITNLLDNAVKYSPETKDIAVTLGQDNGWIVISIQDQGVGISREEQKKIFERFHRVGTGLVHDVKGSGLGLSIVKHIVQSHNGNVVVESVPGRGSTFSIRLPIEVEEANA